MKKLGTPTREYTDEHGIHRIEVAGEEGSWLRVSDMVKFICSLNTAFIADPAKREAVTRFQREAPLLQPAAAHRQAVDMLKSFGAVVPPELERLPLTKLDGGK